MKEYDQELHYFNHYSNELKFHIRSYEFLTDYDNLIFEGSQGIMLDMNHGIFPNVTYANTTSKNAIEISKKLNIKDIEIYYVTRCYQTRHGIGWMSGKDLMGEVNNPDETNVLGEWQGEFRIKEIDYDLLNYAIGIDNIYSGGLPKNLVVTCLDQRTNFKFEYHKLVVNFNNIFNSFSPDSESLNLVDSAELLSTY
jgi:adenylosuccinate synthase